MITVYILKPQTERGELMARLDAIPHGDGHYSEPLPPYNPPTYPFDLWPVDDRAQAVLTPEEWSSRLDAMPPEFIRPDPS